MTTTLVATTTRTVCFALKADRANRTLVTDTHIYPAGITVYAKELRDGSFIVRIPGTLWESHVYAATLMPV